MFNGTFSETLSETSITSVVYKIGYKDIRQIYIPGGLLIYRGHIDGILWYVFWDKKS